MLPVVKLAVLIMSKVKNMKVAFFTVFFLEHGGGLGKYFIETASNLSKTPPIKADVITMDDRFTMNIMKMTHVFYMSFVLKMDMRLVYKESTESIRRGLGSACYFKVGSIASLKKKLQEYDLIYSKNEVLEAFILKFLVGYKNLPPVIFGCHTPFYYPQTISLQSKLHNFLYNSFVYRFLTSDVKAFHVTNTFDENNLRKLFPNKKITKIYLPLNLAELTKLSKKFVFNFKWSKKKFNILWAGRLAEGKGIPELLWIIDYLNNNGFRDKVVFNIAGDGSKILRESINQTAKKWNNVNYFGSVEYKYMPSIYSNNDLFICTSRWETFSYSVLEAQAYGLPAIAFDIPGPRDIIESSKTGFLVVDENEFVEKIMKTLMNRKFFKSEIIKKVTRDKFNPKKIYKQLREMLLDLL
jgi:glycosyltransferase involved in cell wall biosynthesis